MSNFIQIHMLTSYPPANLNRDDMGRPKTAKMGGTDRLRVSSQSLKRAWRTSDIFEEALGEHIGTRTKLWGVKTYEYLTKKEIDKKSAIEWSKQIAGVFGALKKIETKTKKDDDGATQDVDHKETKKIKELEIEQLVHISPLEQKKTYALLDKLIEEKRAPNVDELKLLRKESECVDIALFGRMLASSPANNIEAACQVAHAVSVHPVVIEDDYFTAVDDLNDGMEDAGAAHLGETYFAAGLFYSYICINETLLIENLDKNEELAKKAIGALIEAAVKIAPSGKQNSFASRAYASYVLAEKGEQQPRSLSVSFLKAIENRDNNDFGNAAVAALKRQKESFDQVYGKCSETTYDINVFEGKGTLTELLTFLK